MAPLPVPSSRCAPTSCPSPTGYHFAQIHFSMTAFIAGAPIRRSSALFGQRIEPLRPIAAPSSAYLQLNVHSKQRCACIDAGMVRSGPLSVVPTACCKSPTLASILLLLAGPQLLSQPPQRRMLL